MQRGGISPPFEPFCGIDIDICLHHAYCDIDMVGDFQNLHSMVFNGIQFKYHEMRNCANWVRMTRIIIEGHKMLCYLLIVIAEMTYPTSLYISP